MIVFTKGFIMLLSGIAGIVIVLILLFIHFRKTSKASSYTANEDYDAASSINAKMMDNTESTVLLTVDMNKNSAQTSKTTELLDS